MQVVNNRGNYGEGEYMGTLYYLLNFYANLKPLESLLIIKNKSIKNKMCLIPVCL